METGTGMGTGRGEEEGRGWLLLTDPTVRPSVPAAPR